MGRTAHIKTHPGSIVPGNDLSILSDKDRLKEEYDKCNTLQKQRIIAFVASIYTGHQIAEMFGIARSGVYQCIAKHRDILESAQLSRNFGIANKAERKVIEILDGMKPEKMEEDKKAQSARNLMEVAQMAMEQVKPKGDDDSDCDTMRLILKVKSKLRPRQVEENAPIDVTDSVIVEQPKELTNGQ
jgi:predicted DNA-binding protein YlxM (UPF0122 family)